MKKSIWRKEFDPTAEFVVRKTLLFGGQSFKPGQPFTPKTSKRQLRILYDGRFIEFAPVAVEVAPADEVVTDPPLSDERVDENVDDDQPTEQESTQEPPVDEAASDDQVNDTPADDSQTTEPGIDETQTTEPEPEPEPEPDAGPQFRIVMVSRGWHKVVDANDKQIHEKKLRLKDAEKLLSDKR